MGLELLPAETALSEDGLRYASRPNGYADFGHVTSTVLVRSCFLCGKHIAPSTGMFRRLLGAKQFVCGANLPCRKKKA